MSILELRTRINYSNGTFALIYGVRKPIEQRSIVMAFHETVVKNFFVKQYAYAVTTNAIYYTDKEGQTSNSLDRCQRFLFKDELCNNVALL